MNIIHAKTKVLIDGQEVHARGITSTDEYLTIQDAEVPPISGKQTVCVIYPGGRVWSRVCDCRMELTESGVEYRYYPVEDDG
jgi:hypothetical protein